MSNQKGTIFIVTGPSGAGKGTVLGKVMPRMSHVFYSVSATTRAPRQGEVDGKNYYFLTHKEFEQMIADDKLLEYAEYVNNYYGTPTEPVDAQLAQGKDIILEIEVQGAIKVKAKRPDAVLIFIAPPKFEMLEGRLRGRGTENEEFIQKRLAKARKEYESVENYDYIVINDELELACSELESIIKATRCKTTNRKNILR